jgi:non-homologous end joining protein Ku
MAPRANWKGFLRLSLVTCPVALYPATSDSEKISKLPFRIEGKISKRAVREVATRQGLEARRLSQSHSSPAYRQMIFWKEELG